LGFAVVAFARFTYEGNLSSTIYQRRETVGRADVNLANVIPRIGISIKKEQHELIRFSSPKPENNCHLGIHYQDDPIKKSTFYF
jgi:hypothetical protein